MHLQGQSRVKGNFRVKQRERLWYRYLTGLSKWGIIYFNWSSK